MDANRVVFLVATVARSAGGVCRHEWPSHPSRQYPRRRRLVHSPARWIAIRAGGESISDMSESTGPRAYARIAPVAIVSHSHPSLSKGGAEIAAYTLFSGLSALDCDVTFITACGEKDRSKLSLGSARECAVF